MGEVIGEYLPLAVALTIIPIPIVAVILMLFTPRARANSLAFLAAWIISIGGAMTVLVSATSTQDVGDAGNPSSLGAWVRVVLGVALIGLAAKQWTTQPTDGATPAWMKKIDALTPPGAAGLAVVLAVANPKNLILMAGGAVVIAQADLGSSDQVVAIVVFSLIPSLSIAIPTLGSLILGARAQPALDRARSLLQQHNAAIMAVLLLVIGVMLLGRGVSALS